MKRSGDSAQGKVEISTGEKMGQVRTQAGRVKKAIKQEQHNETKINAGCSEIQKSPQALRLSGR